MKGQQCYREKRQTAKFHFPPSSQLERKLSCPHHSNWLRGRNFERSIHQDCLSDQGSTLCKWGCSSNSPLYRSSTRTWLCFLTLIACTPHQSLAKCKALPI
ncbi:hypothetical protein FGO68_gene13380 [Halteria grandinella]|uniref:Uncharacterized protein n=1 Tax=Halteria grandinella TaxID=5974 RepID=A0A8J8T824_HALGN|nr:hypothetical protein FGO68_gene13380 [Halteria grandinella]